MAYTITNDETNRTFSFNSEASFERALDWYNSTSKAEIITFCKNHDVSLFENETTLFTDWAEVAMQLFAEKAAA